MIGSNRDDAGKSPDRPVRTGASDDPPRRDRDDDGKPEQIPSRDGRRNNGETQGEDAPRRHGDRPLGGGRGPLPRPVVGKSRWPFPLIWVVPLIAAALAGYYFYDRHRERGPEIVISFNDGSGLKPSETVVSVRGVKVGQVTSVALSDDRRRAIVHARLDRANASIANAATKFWVVRPEISITNVSGLSAVVSGPYIEAVPGRGDVAAATEFAGLDGPPVMVGTGERLVLHAVRIERLQVESPVTYRGIQVGVVQDIRLADVADAANVTVFVWDRYATLVRPGSQFWVVSGTDIKGGLFSGIDVKLGSLKSILTGGVAFATPDEKIGLPVGDGSEFTLHDEPKDEWLKWKAVIPLPPESHESDMQTDAGAKRGADAIPSLKKG